MVWPGSVCEGGRGEGRGERETKAGPATPPSPSPLPSLRTRKSLFWLHPKIDVVAERPRELQNQMKIVDSRWVRGFFLQVVFLRVHFISQCGTRHANQSAVKKVPSSPNSHNVPVPLGHCGCWSFLHCNLICLSFSAQRVKNAFEGNQLVKKFPGAPGPPVPLPSRRWCSSTSSSKCSASATSCG